MLLVRQYVIDCYEMNICLINADREVLPHSKILPHNENLLELEPKLRDSSQSTWALQSDIL